jgi:uncharacterized glyoxalase superfamily protein PhnB
MVFTTYLIVKDMAKSLAFYRAFFQAEPFSEAARNASPFSASALAHGCVYSSK